MTPRDRNRIIHKHLFQYRACKAVLDDYMQRAFNKTSKVNESGVRAPFISDPTGRGGAALAQLPRKLEEKRRWCKAIEDALAECRLEDGDRDNGLVALLTEYFCLNKPRRQKDQNAEAVEKICAEHGISRSTFFNRMNKVTDIVLYYATRQELI